MSLPNLFDYVRALFTFRPVALTATTNGTGVDTQGFGNGMAVLEVGAVSGTSPTLAVRLQDSPDNVTFTDIPGAVFTTVTAANNTQVLRLRELNLTRQRFVRAVATIGGTSPSFTMGCEILLGDSLIGPVNDD